MRPRARASCSATPPARRSPPAEVDALGSTLFRDVPAGPGYVVSVDDRRVRARDRARLPPTTPPQALYSDQDLQPGYGYSKTRDGTLLSVNVKLPGPVDEGPYPTVVEYSGYDPSNPDADQPASRVAQLLGFATVGVNLRGTGCSGGAYNYFEELESLDGYDVIEAVAAQPWVQHGTVGMVGISFPGITQLFVAKTRPPHLAAITPLSVLDDTYDTLYPGGIFNNGFALGWAKDREADARPATRAGEGQEWARKRIADGDETCRDQPGAAAAVGQRDEGDPRQRVPARRGERRARTRELRARHRRAGVHRRRVAGPGDRQPLRQHARQLLARHPHEDHADERAAPGLARARRCCRSGSSSSTSTWRRRSRRSLRPRHARLASVLLGRVFGPGCDARARPLHRPTRLRVGAARLRVGTTRARAVRRRCARSRRCPRSRPPRRRSRSPARPPPPGTSASDGTLTDAAPSTGGADRFRYDPSAFPRTMTTSGDDLDPTVRLEAGARRARRSGT